MVERFFGKFEIFKVIRAYSESGNLRLALIIRNLPINFAEKNYLQTFVGINDRNYFVTSSLDSLFRISFYVFVGSTLQNIEEIFDHKKMLKTEDLRVYFYVVIFVAFFILEIAATVYGILSYKKMKQEYMVRQIEEEKRQKDMEVFDEI